MADVAQSSGLIDGLAGAEAVGHIAVAIRAVGQKIDTRSDSWGFEIGKSIWGEPKFTHQELTAAPERGNEERTPTSVAQAGLIIGFTKKRRGWGAEATN